MDSPHDSEDARTAAAVLPDAIDDSETYEPPAHGWTCFHCGETFTVWGEARDHFGETQGATAGCLIARVPLETGAAREVGRGLLMALRKKEAANAALRRENEQLDHEAGAYESMCSDFQRRWPQHNGNAVMAYDSMEGRALAVEEQRTELLTALKLLLHEVDESGNGTARDYGWPEATAASRAAIEKADTPADGNQES